MSNGNPPFDWLTFFLGFAIALWIAIVLLFLLNGDDDSDEKDAPQTVVHCSSGHCGHPRPRPMGPFWIPPGGDSIFCTNRQDGGGYVEDAGGGPVGDGGGYVEDGGGYVEDGGGYVEDGGGYVEDTAPRSPAPSADHMNVARETWEYHCETNSDGGGYVEDKTGRDVTVPMRTSGRFVCWKDGLGNAVVLRAEGQGVNLRYFRTRLDRRQNLVLLDGASPSAADIVALPSQPPELDTYAYCMVAKKTSTPVILSKSGDCIAGTCP